MSKYAGVIVRFENKCLLCKRAPHNDFLPNIWSIPSGHVEEGESDVEAAAREFQEETNHTAKKLRYISKMGSASGNGDVALFLMDVKEPIYPDLENSKDGHEHTECDYFTKKNIPNTTPELKKVLEILLKDLTFEK